MPKNTAQHIKIEGNSKMASLLIAKDTKVAEMAKFITNGSLGRSHHTRLMTETLLVWLLQLGLAPDWTWISLYSLLKRTELLSLQSRTESNTILKIFSFLLQFFCQLFSMFGETFFPRRGRRDSPDDWHVYFATFPLRQATSAFFRKDSSILNHSNHGFHHCCAF